MTSTSKPNGDKIFTRKIIETSIRLVVIALLIGWCLIIIKPFFIMLAWALIIAVAIFPFYNKLRIKFKGRKGLAATLVTILLLAVMVLPSFFLAKSLVSSIGEVKNLIINDQFVIPPPSNDVVNWPIVGKPIDRLWRLASTDLVELLSEFSPQLQKIGIKLLEVLSGAGFGLLEFIMSIIICGFFLVNADGGGKLALDIGIRLSGMKGAEFAKDIEITIRNVARGVLGVAFVQAAMAGGAFFVAGVPLAGLWTIISLMLAITQIGLFPVIIPVIIYMFSASDLLTATLLAIWLFFVTIIDNILRPIWMGRKAPVPMLVIFLGSMGGFITSGIIGLFLGAVILSLGYKLFLLWLNAQDEASGEENLVSKSV